MTYTYCRQASLLSTNIVRTHPIPWHKGSLSGDECHPLEPIPCSKGHSEGRLSSPGRSSPVSGDSQGMARGWRSLGPGDGSPESGPLPQGMASGCTSAAHEMARECCRYGRCRVFFKADTICIQRSCDPRCRSLKSSTSTQQHRWQLEAHSIAACELLGR